MKLRALAVAVAASAALLTGCSTGADEATIQNSSTLDIETVDLESMWPMPSDRLLILLDERGVFMSNEEDAVALAEAICGGLYNGMTRQEIQGVVYESAGTMWSWDEQQWIIAASIAIYCPGEHK